MHFTKLLNLAFCYFIFGSFAAKAQAVDTQDSLALVDLYNSTNGIKWEYHDNWLTTAPLNTWFGVTVSDGRVSAIKLPLNNLDGTLTASLGNLTMLKTLWLQNNNVLRGGLPASIGNMANLTDIDLSYDDFRGSIPSSFGNLISLSNLRLFHNLFSDSIPSSLSRLSNLELLDLSENRLSGSIPAELGKLKNLKKLNLYNNALTGSIPDSLGNMQSLTYLTLMANNLTGSIPPSLSNLSNLTFLDVSYNKLTGGIPPSLGNLSNLSFLLLGYNQLTDSIPESLGNLVKLTDLMAFNNNLTGRIPASFAKLVNVEYLNLSSNQLSGTVPNLPESNYLLLDISINHFTFSGMEKLPYADDLEYAPQLNIPLINNNNTLSVSAGGTPSNNTYNLYLNNQLIKTQVADSVFIITATGSYYITITNKIAPKLTLQSVPLKISTLPLTLLNLTGSLVHNTSLLQWQATNEINTNYFIVERCITGNMFTAIGVMNAINSAGINKYRFVDTNISVGSNLYRLKMVDKDGSFTYSNVIAVKLVSSILGLKIYPNPTDGVAQINFYGTAYTQCLVTIADNAGRIISKSTINCKQGINTMQIDMHGYAAGLYFVSINDTNGTYKLKLIKK